MEEKEVETVKEGPAIDGEGGDGAKSNHTANSAEARTPPVSSITFHDLSYEVTQRKCFRRLPNKIILRSVRSALTGVTSYGFYCTGAPPLFVSGARETP